MKELWSSPLFRKSSFNLLIRSLIFWILLFGLYRIQVEHFKESYILTAGSVVQKAVELQPSLEKELVSAFMKENGEADEEKAKAFLKRYFVHSRLEDEVFPGMAAKLQSGRKNFFLAFLLFLILSQCWNAKEHLKRYRPIRAITDWAERSIRGESVRLEQALEEGEIGALGQAFENMDQILKSSMSELAKEKEFLKEILADISHQLKTPLASLVLYTELMHDENLSSADRERFLVCCDEQLQRMQWLIHSLLTLARMDAGSIVFAKEYKSLQETMEQAVDSLSGWIEQKRLSICWQVSSKTFFDHDVKWIKEAFANILKNAVEYSAEGARIDISIQDYPVFKRVTITDYGEGIDEQELPKIFKRFYRAKRSSDKENGTSVGIGLSLAQAIVKAHGGYIEAISKKGEMTKFSIVFVV